MKRKMIYIIAIACLAFAACEKEINMELPSTSTKLVVNCLFSPDTVFKVYVSRTAKVIGTDAPENIENATVEIYKNGQILETLNHLDKGLYTSVNFPEAGIEYTLKVSAPGYESITATSIIPEKTVLLNVNLNDNAYQGPYSSTYAKISGEFADPAAENYYLVELTCVDTVYHYSPKIYLVDALNENSIISSESPLGIILMTDELFNGKTYQLETYFANFVLKYQGEYKKFTLRLKSLSKEAYYYYKTAELQISGEYNPFAEPARVYTNLTNGLGIFAGYNESKVEFKVKK